MDGSIPQACTCPADDRFDGACKHRVAIAIRRPDGDQTQRSSRDTARIRGDGGSSIDPDTEDVVSPNSTERPTDVSNPDECEECLPEFPCWDCYRRGRRDFY
ncbi:SWIM zinc finger family protein [Haloarcula sp. S1AR25-5A]|uniref:SWIM zinc finger family protein n=2 Tax=Haloarcula terrestris TaxID=2950533 RepID=A0AAE4JIE2_9EURY|nr:SWIM zinc finger family protein [Haloarcula terrestris]